MSPPTYPRTPKSGVESIVPRTPMSGADSSLPISGRGGGESSVVLLTETFFILQEDGYMILKEDRSGFIEQEH